MPAYKLISTTGDQTFEVPPSGTMNVGRAVTSDIPVYDPTVSRNHAEISASENGITVKDLGSSNGTFVNGNRITEETVSHGDVVTFGKVAFKVREVTLAQAVVPPEEKDQSFPSTQPEATIIRQLPVRESGGFAQPTVEPSGTSYLKVSGESEDERQAMKLNLLLDISKELAKQQDVEKLLEKVVDITFHVMDVDRVSILMVEEGSADLAPRTSKTKLGEMDAGRHVPRSIASRCVNERLAILTDNAAADERFKSKSILMQSVRSAMCTPLMGNEGNVLGIIYVDNMTATNSFGDEDLEFLIAFSSIAAVAIENSELSNRIAREAVVLANFQRYFAPDLAQQIVGQDGAVRLGGAKRPVVVFFSDIRGFTTLSEQMNPDDIASLLTEYFTEMVEILFEHDGTLDKFMGDAIMALWGAPISHDDDADRAVATAIDMMRVLEELNQKWAEQGRPHLDIGIGINFGDVFAGNIGSDRRLEYTVIGDSVNVASRLCSMAGPGEVLISEPFLKRLNKPLDVDTLEPMQLKGKAQAIPVYRVKL